MRTNYTHRFKEMAIFTIALTFFSTATFAQAGKNDSTFNPPDNGPDAIYKGVDAAVQLSASQSDNNKIVLAGDFSKYNSQSHSKIVRIHTDGTVDNTFQEGTGLNNTPNTLLVQPDNRIIIAGNFTTYNGTPTHGILRLLENGSIDPSFSIGTGLAGNVYQAQLQQDGKILLVGDFTTFNNQPVKRLLRLNANGTLDATFTLFDTTYSPSNKIAIQADGKIIVTLTTIRQLKVIRLNTDGTRDASFTSVVPFEMSYVPVVKAVEVQTDGKILIGGYGVEGGSPHFLLLKRINTNGSLDTAFAPLDPGHIGTIYAVRLQSDGKIIAAGQKDRSSDSEHTESHYIARFNIDGTLDNTFLSNNHYFVDVPHAIYTTLVLSNGKVFAGGYFPEINTYTAYNIALLNADGTVDVSFNKTAGVNGTIKTSTIQADQKTLIGGLFSAVQFESRSHVARLLADGTLDTSFNPGKGTNGPVYAIASQADGKIIIGGDFSTYNGLPANSLVRVNSDGSIDPSYNIGDGVNGIVYTLAVQNNNKVIAGGNFNKVNGVYSSDVTRINTDGSVDITFTGEVTAAESNTVYTSLVLPNGKILIGGYFTARHNSVDRKHLVRLNADGTLDPAFQQVNYSDYRDLVLQPNGKIIACGGHPSSEALMGLGFLERYNEDGTQDITWTDIFEPGAKPLYSITRLSTGKIIAGGEFTWFNGFKKQYLQLIDSTGAIDSSFVGQVDGPVYTTNAVVNNKVIIGGSFQDYTGTVRNNIGRIFGEEDVISGIKEQTHTATFAVYPNPAASYIHADQLKPGSIVTIRTVMGSLLYLEQINTNYAVINISNYANGTYFITQQYKMELHTQRFIVNR